LKVESDFHFPFLINFVILWSKNVKIMTTLESTKYRLISSIIGDTDKNRVLEIERLYNQEPCVYSNDEMRASVIQRKKDFESGKINAIPHEQLKRRLV
jgi:hypothetical protein